MDGFKQRIIGALVLISLAVIFVPMLLDEPHDERRTQRIDIPAEPDFPEVRIEPAEPPALTDPIEPIPAPENPPLATSADGGVANSGDSSGGSSGDSAVVPMTEEIRVQPQAPVESVPDEPAPVQAETTPATEPQAPVEQPEPEPETPTASPEAVMGTGGYLVQLGSFGNRENADRLSQSAEEKGFSSHVLAVETGGSTFNRVYVGPFPDKSAAESAKDRLDEAFGLNALVVVNDE